MTTPTGGPHEELPMHTDGEPSGGLFEYKIEPMEETGSDGRPEIDPTHVPGLHSRYGEDEEHLRMPERILPLLNRAHDISHRAHSRYREPLIGMLNIDFKEPKYVDGTSYAAGAFGGFGPGSPEYDNSRRLRIVIPDSRTAVRWFEDTAGTDGRDALLGPSMPERKFTAFIPEIHHPAIQQVDVVFKKSEQTSLIAGQITTRHNALDVDDIPEQEGFVMDTRTPGRKMLAEHMKDRMEALFPGMVETGKDGKHALVTVEDGIDFYINYTSLPNITVTVNGSVGGGTYGRTVERYGEHGATPEQLEKELLALQEHFPAIAEAHADFFRKQLPRSRIEVSYARQRTADSDKNDPLYAMRMNRLWEELLVEPREDDFKYVGGLAGPIERLTTASIGFAHPEAYRAFGTSPPRGILLSGPPGVGKTTLAMGFARESGAVLVNLKPSVIKNAFHGETERNIRAAFQIVDELVADGMKVVVFIDELESLAPARDSFGSSNVDVNVTTELLQALNVDRPNCVVIGATNIPGKVDPALTNNSSRFSEQIEIDLPDETAIEDIFQKLFLKFSDRSTGGDAALLFDSGIQLDTLIKEAHGLSGADIEAAIRTVLTAKAVMFATTGQRPGPASNGELYQSLKAVAAQKQKTGNNYL